MKRKETVFFKALGGIPQSYIDELTQWQAAHTPADRTDHNTPEQRLDELQHQKECITMKHTEQQPAVKNKEAGISVRKLTPVTVGIFASLAACAVVAVGFGTGFFKKNGINTPAASMEQSDTDTPESVEESLVDEESESVQPEESVTEEQVTDEEATRSEKDRIYEVYSCYGDNTETGGLPDVPENGAMLFTSMDELRPVLERAVNTDFPVKGVQHAESCFTEGRNILIIKTKWLLDSYDSMVRALYVTADNYLHADIASCRSDNFDPGLDPASVTHSYIMLSVPGSLQNLGGSNVQQSLFLFEDDSDSFRDEMVAYMDDGVYLEHLANNDADYIFPELTFEMFTPETIEGSNAWMLGSMMVKMEDMENFALPANIKSDITEIVEPNLTQLNENTLIGINNVESGASPYISVYEDLSAPERILVYPEQKYNQVFTSGTRVTLLSSSALLGSAEMQAPLEDSFDADLLTMHTEEHASRLLIVNKPETAVAAEAVN